MKDLNKLRDEINSLDQKMKELFLKRMDVVKDIYSYKKEHDLKFIKLILDTSKEYQNKLKEKEGK